MHKSPPKQSSSTTWGIQRHQWISMTSMTSEVRIYWIYVPDTVDGRNPASVDMVNIDHYLQGFSTIPGGCSGISEPSTVWIIIRIMSHEVYPMARWDDGYTNTRIEPALVEVLVHSWVVFFSWSFGKKTGFPFIRLRIDDGFPRFYQDFGNPPKCCPSFHESLIFVLWKFEVSFGPSAYHSGNCWKHHEPKSKGFHAPPLDNNEGSIEPWQRNVTQNLAAFLLSCCCIEKNMLKNHRSQKAMISKPFACDCSRCLCSTAWEQPNKVLLFPPDVFNFAAISRLQQKYKTQFIQFFFPGMFFFSVIFVNDSIPVIPHIFNVASRETPTQAGADPKPRSFTEWHKKSWSKNQ